MNVEAHLETLTLKHADLDRKIDAEMQAPLPDSLRLTKLKREKLHLKERMATLQD